MEGNIKEDRLLIKEIVSEKKIGSIYIPKTANSHREGEVVLSTCMADVGDTVIFKADGVNVKVDGVKYLLLTEKNILYIR